MLVYGDQVEHLDPRERLEQIAAGLAAVQDHGPGLERHDAIVSALLQAGQLAQALADLAFAERGADDLDPTSQAAEQLTLTVARQLVASWRSGFMEPGARAEREIQDLAHLPLPHTASGKVPEGYAFYAVYPEAYVEAAALARLERPPAVLGLRSIGTSLGAVVAAACGAESFVTARPCGHPFARELQLSADVKRRLLRRDRLVAVVDEGPGLSGSSFGAAGDLLETAEAEAVYFPSHAGSPGSQASARHAVRWAKSRRSTVDFDGLRARSPLHDPARWFADLTGELTAPMEDLSGGAWRSGALAEAPAFPQQERRKFRLTARNGVFLARFAGLGPSGEAKFDRARALHAAGFTPEPLALRRGFLLERWVEGAPQSAPADEALVGRLADYLSFRAARLPANPGQGATLDELRRMAEVNIGEGVGEGFLAELRPRLAAAPARTPRPVHVDGRLHRWEWLRTSAGQIVKTDAVDHCCAHDLIGCQDIAWDVAGAVLELELSAQNRDRLARAVGVDQGLYGLFEICYPAFQLGLWSFARDAAQGSDRAIAEAQVRRYERRLQLLARSDVLNGSPVTD